ncbi:branched-chain amino acid ABC transporter permease [Salirhabdus sp. Marseille-P4669]|uniref:branched-chain amino acid ABC transporter permease n=1 Tax=Salirhabdus sp. Marseille-P4669 TaxID=2042310 RepID=UPI000C7977D0|nr:branched-chain amino acid ABC transporter permease [Salirhabdus sp. Marseille-P4669]
MDIIFTLTLNGLAIGMLFFLLAAGLTLVFGLMDVLNFAHGGLFVWGAYTGLWVYSLSSNFWIGVLGAIVAGLLIGAITELFIIKPVYGNHVQQILITLGFLLVLSELIKVVFGADIKAVQPPSYLDGNFALGDLTIIKYRLFLIVMGLFVFILTTYILKKTRIGLIVRAGVINKEMVQALGINIRLVFMAVFMVGSAMAALGGFLFVNYSGTAFPELGIEYGIFAFIVVVIGGMGSFSGSLLAAILVGLAQVYFQYYLPSLAIAVNMILMTAVLLLRPQGLFTTRGVSTK